MFTTSDILGGKETRQFNKNQYKVMLPDLKRQFAWLKYPNSQSLQSAVDNLYPSAARLHHL
ncbi:hypothetical protein BRW62_12430 [Parathermosynechococcus lividus PCC 6715]|uniref:Uncharacterized protein n=1 Tax=Parathermosynechococcus lividus PCC 6715 TaxID=1917166 RepID=A0A2D2Q4F2_PARLV|nr:hypothetical protein BRW62_12430 [Thermostichus lividus PCC 6715]